MINFFTNSQSRSFAFLPSQLHVCPGTLRAVWTAYPTLSGSHGTTQTEPSATLRTPKGPKVPTLAAHPRLQHAKCRIWSVGHFTPSKSQLWIHTAAVMSVPLLTLRQVFNKTLSFLTVWRLLGIYFSSSVACPLGPCALNSISTVTECYSETILVQWEQTANNPIYVAIAETQDQTIISCNSSSNSCALQGIRCDTQYSIIVSASSNKCSNLRSPPVTIKTGISVLFCSKHEMYSNYGNA